MKCLEKCEFLNFASKVFNCEYYAKELDTRVDGVDEIFLEPQRCKECVEEAHIGSNTVNEDIKKVKHRLGLMVDSFYSFKDDLESELTEIYRILKKVEEETDHAEE